MFMQVHSVHCIITEVLGSNVGVILHPD